MITVLMPVYNEGKYIYNNVMKVDSLLIEKGIEHQFLLVDDGSNDNTWDEMCRLASDYPHVSIIRLSRNFGKESRCAPVLKTPRGRGGDYGLGFTAPAGVYPGNGAALARGRLQRGRRCQGGPRKESLGSKLAALLFYRTFRRTTGIDIGVASDFKLMDRSAVEAWKNSRKKHLFPRLSAWVGFKRCTLPFKVAPRRRRYKWTFSACQACDKLHYRLHRRTAVYRVLAWVLMGIGAVILGIQTLYNYFAHQSVPDFQPSSCCCFYRQRNNDKPEHNRALHRKIYDEVKARPRYIIMSKKEMRF